MTETVPGQRAALQDWVAGLVAPDPRSPAAGALREQRREAAQHDAVVSRVLDAYDAHLAVEAPAGAGAVVVHRQEWTRRAVAQELGSSGLPVLATLEEGAAALGAVVALQPAVVLVEQRLPWLDGLTVVRGVRALAPATRVVVHLDGPDAEADALAAGAHGAAVRETSARDLAGRVLLLLEERAAEPPRA